MFFIDENEDGTYDIFITRGDTGRATVTMKYENGTTYVPQAGDVVRFLAKHFYSSKMLAISKIVPNDTQLLWLEPKDTKDLPWGKYKYDLELTYADGDVDTFAQGVLTIGEEVDGEVIE